MVSPSDNNLAVKNLANDNPADRPSAGPVPPDRQSTPVPVTRKTLPPAAERALAEAARRRAEIDGKANSLARNREVNGRGGLEPVRYDDWEVKGIASDF